MREKIAFDLAYEDLKNKIQIENIEWGNIKSVFSLICGVFPNISFSSDLRNLVRWKMGSAFISS